MRDGVERTLLPGGLLDLGGHAVSDEPVAGLELLHGLGGVVDEGKAGALATTEVCLEAEDGDIVLLGLVELTELATELVLGDVGAVGVEDIPVGKKSIISMPLFPCWFVPNPCCLSDMSEFQYSILEHTHTKYIT